MYHRKVYFLFDTNFGRNLP